MVMSNFKALLHFSQAWSSSNKQYQKIKKDKRHRAKNDNQRSQNEWEWNISFIFITLAIRYYLLTIHPLSHFASSPSLPLYNIHLLFNVMVYYWIHRGFPFRTKQTPPMIMISHEDHVLENIPVFKNKGGLVATEEREERKWVREWGGNIITFLKNFYV